ncbi:bud site selection protein, partial [Coemansia brasiliensis]
GIDPEVAALLAEAYVNGDEEVKAVQVMHQALKAKPSCYPMLSTQAEFLRLKKQFSAARKIALMAVKYAPSEFHAWAELTKVYVDDNDFSNALLTLNTCPMYTYVDRDYPRVPTPRRINYPVKSEILAEYNLGDNFTNGNYGPVPMNPRSSTDSDAPGVAEEIAQNESSFILRLAAPTLKGTFAHAYKLLTGIVSTIGWDELLQLRSNVFVMEEEYRNSVGPSVAVDDEEDDEDDSVPLSALKKRQEAASDSQQTGNGKAEITTSEAQTPEAQPNENTKADTADSAQGDDQTSESNELKKETTADKPEEIQDDPEEDDEKSKSESQPTKPKGKKKKKGRGKRSNVQEQATTKPQEAESTEPVEQSQDKEPEVIEEPTNGLDPKQNEVSIAALGDQMDDVSLSDKDKPMTEVAAPQIAARETKEQADEQQSEQNSHLETQPSEEQDVPHVRKRLCERWLDNLIMILFDDLRTYTNWRTKMHNMRATGQQVVHQFTQAEWEALGDLALRLHRPSEAREAFECALRIRFSAKAWRRLLELHTGKYAAIQEEEVKRHDNVVPPLPLTSTDSLMMALDAAVWLAVYNDRWYNSMAYPNPLCNHIIKLVNIHGLSKVHNSLISMNLKPAVFSMIKRHLEIAEKFDVTGAKW